MCSSHRPEHGADSGEYPPLTAAESLNVYVADSIVRNNPSGWREWLRAKQHALQEERVAIVERLIDDRIIPSAFTDSARRVALDPTVDLEDGLPPRTSRMRSDRWRSPVDVPGANQDAGGVARGPWDSTSENAARGRMERPGRLPGSDR